MPVRDMTFEAALKELETIVARLEQGEVDLEDSIALYERGQALKAIARPSSNRRKAGWKRSSRAPAARPSAKGWTWHELDLHRHKFNLS